MCTACAIDYYTCYAIQHAYTRFVFHVFVLVGTHYKKKRFDMLYNTHCFFVLFFHSLFTFFFFVNISFRLLHHFMVCHLACLCNLLFLVESVEFVFLFSLRLSRPNRPAGVLLNYAYADSITITELQWHVRTPYLV